MNIIAALAIQVGTTYISFPVEISKLFIFIQALIKSTVINWRRQDYLDKYRSFATFEILRFKDFTALRCDRFQNYIIIISNL